MDIKDMTPAQLREYAAEKERTANDMRDRYLCVNESPKLKTVEGKKPLHPWDREVEFEGETYTVDMRRTKSREFVRLVAAMQKSANQSGDGSAEIADVIAVFDYLFGGEVDDKVAATVRASKGYDDFEEIMRIEGAIFEAVGAKN